MKESFRVLVTGDHDDLNTRYPVLQNNENVEKRVDWVSLSVLDFERLPIEQSLLSRVCENPFEWILFTSPRAVTFWNEVLLEESVDFPIETQVACIGESTAEKAALDGYTPDFYPTESGSEGFLAEFESLVLTNERRPSIFIPMAESGRTLLKERLGELGCEVVTAPLYRTVPKTNLQAETPKELFQNLDALVFTSPSSAEAFLNAFTLPSLVPVISMGRFTSSFLDEKQIKHVRLPESNFEKLFKVGGF